MYSDPYGLFSMADMPLLPQGVMDVSMGIADSVSLGLGPLARAALDIDGGVNRCSVAYKAGEYGSLVLGTGRLLYAGAAKALPFAIRGSDNAMARALQISTGRNTLKRVARAGLFPNARMPSAAQILNKYPDPDAIITAATRTNRAVNAVGANATAGAVVNSATCGCD